MSNTTKEEDLPDETKQSIKESGLFYGLRKTEYECCIENYYDDIKDFTPRTVIIPISYDETKDLYDACNIYYKKKKIEYDKITPFVEKIDKVKEETGITKFFCKLSCRSPKDYWYSSFSSEGLHPKFTKIFDPLLDECDGTDIGYLYALNKASRLILEMRSGKEAMEMFVQSERIRGDLMKNLEFPKAFKLSLIFREWEQFNPHFEFRGFVYEQNLTALGQYCYTEYVKELPSQKDKIEKLIREFYDENIKDRVKIKNYVIDFAVIGEKVRVIELNPFFTDTGSGLFRWGKDTVLTGKKNFEFRIVEKPLENPLDGLPSSISSYIQNYKNKKQQNKQNTKCLIS